MVIIAKEKKRRAIRVPRGWSIIHLHPIGSEGLTKMMTLQKRTEGSEN